MVAFIPARSGSKRIIHKNIRPLGNHPLIAYTIEVALMSDVFSRVYVSSDHSYYCAIARAYGAKDILRPFPYSDFNSPDIDWITHALSIIPEQDEDYCILRPTNPFRTVATVRRAWSLWQQERRGADSMRAVQLCKQHPLKMWVISDGNMHRMRPAVERICTRIHPENPHNHQYSMLPDVYVQTASLEMAWRETPLKKQSTCGDEVIPFLTSEAESIDLNTEIDWMIAEALIEKGVIHLPPMRWENVRFEHIEGCISASDVYLYLMGAFGRSDEVYKGRYRE